MLVLGNEEMEHQELGKSAMGKRGPSIDQVTAVYDELVLWVRNEEMGLQALGKSAMGKRETSIDQVADVYDEPVLGKSDEEMEKKTGGIRLYQTSGISVVEKKKGNEQKCA